MCTETKTTQLFPVDHRKNAHKEDKMAKFLVHAKPKLAISFSIPFKGDKSVEVEEQVG